jgi:putative FmdB family regulatory protein
MPIYAYRCEDCGFQQDVLQKMSDPLLVNCPSCGEPKYRKQITAAGFQLKGSGWYVTDFRNPAVKETAKSGASEGSGDGGKKPEAAPTESKSASADSAAPAPAPATPSNDSKAETKPSKTPAPSSGST